VPQPAKSESDVDLAGLDRAAALVHDQVARSTEQGREIGIYGPELSVPTGAYTLDRRLALSGRAPRWTP